MRKTEICIAAVVCIFCGCSFPTKIPPAPRPSSTILEVPSGEMFSSVVALPFQLVSSKEVPFFADDMDKQSLLNAIDENIKYCGKITQRVQYRIGESFFGAEDLYESLIALREILGQDRPKDQIQWLIEENFNLYLSAGYAGTDSTLFTGYYEPVMRGSVTRTERFKYPIYRVPEDVLRIKLERFGSEFGKRELVGRVENGEVLPYYSRSQIDQYNVLEGRGLEIIWVDDPVELFFLHIQGSGRIELENGETRCVGYALKNGRSYRSIGSYMLRKGKITSGDNNHQRIKTYLKTHPDECSEIFGWNESYVFFQFVEEGPVGAIGAILTPGRSIAVDPSAFPLGAPAFIQTRKPTIDKGGRIVSWEPFSRFVVSQDTGGAIKGAGRVDLFCGRGPEAEMLAGSIREDGKLYFLLKKDSKIYNPDSRLDTIDY